MKHTEQFKRGQADGLKGGQAYYGCHLGMRSTLEADKRAYFAGHARGMRVEYYLRKRASRG